MVDKGKLYECTLWTKVTMIPGEEAWIMSGLNFATSPIILGLSASESGTF